jgi:transcriptional regulator with XRE-family HTH domain
MRGGAGPFAARFGANLAYCRNRAGGLSQEVLGMRAELHRTAVGQLERGERVARTDTLVKLAGSLGIPYDELLDGLLWTPSIRTAGAMDIEPFVGQGNGQALAVDLSRTEGAR